VLIGFERLLTVFAGLNALGRRRIDLNVRGQLRISDHWGVAPQICGIAPGIFSGVAIAAKIRAREWFSSCLCPLWYPNRARAWYYRDRESESLCF